MAKKIEGYIKLNIPAGAANPSPPVGPALGQRGVNIMEFCKAFNASTESLEKNMPIPVVITVFSDKSFSFIIKTYLSWDSLHHISSEDIFSSALLTLSREIFAPIPKSLTISGTALHNPPAPIS